MLKLKLNVATRNQRKTIAAKLKKQKLVIQKIQKRSPRKIIVVTIARNVIPAPFIL
ncbi:hypothetical protein IV494_10640 [Kaistella sp. G5-32]|uniref:50S ribosomal protein L35 n=1 Tax=Kaistella gelatinilytica TaxID=2787636 RepID=A0ABS0FDB2_9FLAO|nr:hypothetical protein [Kaistella gelatinilytica]MBF8457636.1 hypothetical protein [Kaistella gelatinilytica]